MLFLFDLYTLKKGRKIELDAEDLEIYLEVRGISKELTENIINNK